MPVPKSVALIVEAPAASAVARPPLAIVATDVFDELQVTDDVRFWVVLSEKVPVAVNCAVNPFATDGPAGVTAMLSNTGGVTVRTVDPVTPASTALIVVGPVVTARASPFDPWASEI